MTDEFLTILKILEVFRPLGAGRHVPTNQFVAELRRDPERLELEKSFFEHVFTTGERPAAERLLRLLYSTLTYLSNLIDGPVPVLLPRADVSDLQMADQDGRGATLAIARALRRCIEDQAKDVQRGRDEHLLSQVEEMFARLGANAAPSNGKFMTSEQVGKMLELAPKTVRRLFTERKLIGRKVGNEWRATRKELEDSPYLRRRRGRNAKME